MTCVGACCAAFPAGGLTYPQLEERYYRLTDGATLFDMLRPITNGEANERRARLGLGPVADDHDEQLYRCVRWDEDTRLCTRYDERPLMCSDYPYGDVCEHEVCDHEEPLLTRLRWQWRKATYGGERSWSWDGYGWQPDLAPLTLPG